MGIKLEEDGSVAMKKRWKETNYKGVAESFKEDEVLIAPAGLPKDSVLAGFPLSNS